MNKRTKIISLLSILFLFVNFGIYTVTEINKEQRIQVALDSHLDKLKTHYEILLHHQKVTATAAYKSTINKKFVIDILSKAQGASSKELDLLREELTHKLKDKYKILHEKGVLQYHFVLPNDDVFLRMHKPSKYGDSLSGIRYSFEYTNKTHKPISGFEQGKTAHGFRNTYPIFDENNNYLASLDVAFSSNFLQDNLVSISKIHTHFLVNKHIFDVKSWKRDDMISNYMQSSEHDDFMMSVMHSDYKEEHIVKNIQRLKPIKAQIYEKMAEEKEFSLYTLFKAKSVVISFYPIKNIKDKKTVAWIVSYDNDSFIDITLRMNLYAQISAFFILLILFYFIYRVINQKEILDIQVKIQTKELAKRERQLKLLNENLELTIKDEVAKNQEKDRLLFQQSKMAAMGEMIGNIAHQWRQPIAIISMWANNIIADIDMEELEDENLKKYAKKINEQTVHLSETIDDFRNFFSPNKEKEIFTLKESVDKTMSLLSASFKTHNIEVIENIEDVKIFSLENELTQAILNIIKNAKDILMTLDKGSRKLIFINIYREDSNVIIEIRDNGGGVPKNIIAKVFEPYFTTKHQS
ncbi:MAG: HAMP domain-containing sensor histidine kinase, partial [Campylobacterota bacterium]|nr:HAMP domain-containing sensor histidine kinase [Campylobacterota bacterium]